MERLRHLILCSLLPGHRSETQPTSEPEDDLTPTPSLVSSACHTGDPSSPGRAPHGGEGPEQEDVALCSLERLPPRARNSGIWESPELDRNPEEETSGTEAAGSYKVVRKGKTNVYTRRGGRYPASQDRGEPSTWLCVLEAKCAVSCRVPAGDAATHRGFGVGQPRFRARSLMPT